MRKSSLLAVSHAVALLAGWLAFRTPAAGTGQAAAMGERATKSGERRAEREEGRRLLREMRERWGTRAAAEDAAAARIGTPDDDSSTKETVAMYAAELEDIRKRVLEVILPDDPGVEFDRLMKEGTDRHGQIAFMIAWLKADPRAALRHLNAAGDDPWSGSFTNALPLWMNEAGSAAVLDVLDEAPKWQAKLAEIVLKAGVAADPSTLGDLMLRLEGKMDRQAMLRAAFAGLPESQRGAALDWIMGNLKGKEAAKTLMNAAFSIQSSLGDKAGAKRFLQDVLARGVGDGVMTELKSWGNFADILGSGVGPDSPMEERLEVILVSGQASGTTPEERRASAISLIVSQDVGKWFREGSLGVALGSESVTVDELWSMAETSFPRYGEGERDSLLREFFKNAAIEDPEGALAFLKQQGKEAEAGRHALAALESSVFTDLEAGLRLVAMLPDEAIRGSLPEYDRYYRSLVWRESAQRDSYWVDWLKQQPAGLNRDLLLHHTATELFKQGKPADAARLQLLIQDPEVKSRPRSAP